jgi:hypothetical protein
LSLPLSERRIRLERFAKEFLGKGGSICLSPATPRLAEAKKWLAQTTSTRDGLIAKRRDLDCSDSLILQSPEGSANAASMLEKREQVAVFFTRQSLFRRRVTLG